MGGGGGKVENKSMSDTKDYINVKSEDNFKKLSEMKKNNISKKKGKDIF